MAEVWLATMATTASGSSGLLFVTTAPDLNELLGIAREHSAELGGATPLTFATVAAAIQAATAGDGLLVTADLYRNPVIGSPQGNCTPTISAAQVPSLPLSFDAPIRTSKKHNRHLSNPALPLTPPPFPPTGS